MATSGTTTTAPGTSAPQKQYMSKLKLGNTVYYVKDLESQNKIEELQDTILYMQGMDIDRLAVTVKNANSNVSYYIGVLKSGDTVNIRLKQTSDDLDLQLQFNRAVTCSVAPGCNSINSLLNSSNKTTSSSTWKLQHNSNAFLNGSSIVVTYSGVSYYITFI